MGTPYKIGSRILVFASLWTGIFTVEYACPEPFRASPLADSFQRCSRSFKKLYLALFAYGPISLSKFNDEYGRFGVWGGDSGADRTGRGSLDDVLRNDSKTTSIIAEVLENLEEDLNTCITLVNTSAGSQEVQSPSGQEWLSDEESSISSGSDLDKNEIGSRLPSKTQRTLHLLAIVVDHIQSLFQVSALLRRPTISDKYLRSVSKRASAMTESPFLQWDLAHVVEKRRFWIRQQKWPVSADMDEAENDPHQTSAALCKRLAVANVRRREQLNFWQDHPAQPTTVKLPDESIRPKPAVIPEATPTGQLIKKAVAKSEMSKPSHGTKQSFSTVAKSDLNDSATFSGRPRTEYASSSKGGKFVLRVPQLPKLQDESPTLKCPYCSTILDAKSMSQRELWKKHVFRDLRPYVCTFEECENPEKLYLTRHDWIYHETQMHRRQWICASCSHQKFPSRNDMTNHLLDTHSGDFPESQLAIMVDICERPLDDDEGADCLICLATLSLSALRIHLATHLEELALFALPCQMEDRSQDEGSDRAEGAAGKSLASDASGSDNGLPALDFDNSLPDTPHSQDPEMFSTLLRSRLESANKHLEDWFSIGQHGETQQGGDFAEPFTAATASFASRSSPAVPAPIQSKKRQPSALLLEHVDNFPYSLPPGLIDGSPDAIEYVGDMKSNCLETLTRMEFAAGEIRHIDWMIQIGRRGGNSKQSEMASLEKERKASETYHAEAKIFVDNFRGQQAAWRAKALYFDEAVYNRFGQALGKACHVRRAVEQLADTILDHPVPKSEVNMGRALEALESLDLEDSARHKSYWTTISIIINELETCTQNMQGIFRTTRSFILDPTSSQGESSIWDLEKDTELLANYVESYTEALQSTATLIMQEYLPDLRKEPWYLERIQLPDSVNLP